MQAAEAARMQGEGAGGGSTAGNLLMNFGLPLGTEIGRRWTTQTLLTSEKFAATHKKHGLMGGWAKNRRRADRAAAETMSTLMGRRGVGGGRGLGMRGRWNLAVKQNAAWLNAPAAAQGLGSAEHLGPMARGTGTRLGSGALKRAATARTIASVARAPLGIANAYFLFGQVLTGAGEATAAGLSELKKFGASLRNSTPETSVGWKDMATREKAFTMRQASLMALHQSQMGTRAALGSEASFMHG